MNLGPNCFLDSSHKYCQKVFQSVTWSEGICFLKISCVKTAKPIWTINMAKFIMKLNGTMFKCVFTNIYYENPKLNMKDYFWVLFLLEGAWNRLDWLDLKIWAIELFFSKAVLFYYYLFWLRWVFVAARRLSLVAVSGGYSSLRCAGFSLRWLLIVEHRL